MGRRSSTPSGITRWDEIVRPGRTARPKRRGLIRIRRVLSYAGILLLVLAVLVAALFTYVQLKLRGNSTQIPSLVDQQPNQPMNVLVLGSDSRAVLSEEELERFDPTGQDRESGQRADTIVLVHLDEEREQAVVIHLPRDLWVEHPSGKLGKINGVYQLGPDAMVRTVESFTGLPIHHYVEVNFVGFLNLVNALGGVEVYFERPIKEDDSGLDVPAGCVRLEGDQALAFVRVRKIDDDFGRIVRQQLFGRLVVEKVTSARTLLNPVKVVQLVNLFAGNVTHDAALTIGDMKDVALRLRTWDASRIDMRVVPSKPVNTSRLSYVVAVENQAEALFAAIRERSPLPDYGRTGVSLLEPDDVRVTALNGTTVNKLGARGFDELKAKGFQVVGKPADADRTDYARTTVYFREGNEDKARFLAGPYGADVKPIPASIGAESEVAIVFGTDYAEGRATPPPPPPPGRGQRKPPIHRCDE